MAKKQIEKINVMFVGNLREDAYFLYKFYKYAQSYKKLFNVFYERLNGFVFIELLLAFAVKLPKEVVAEIYEYNYKLHISKSKDSFYKKWIFTWLAKVYFVKYYTKIYRKNISQMFIYDDYDIKSRACVLACRVMKVNYTIIYNSYKDHYFFIDHFATRWRASIPQNADFYSNLNSQRNTMPSAKHNMVLVLLQDDESVDCVLYAPLVSKQKDLIQIVTNVSQALVKTKFVVFNAKRLNVDTDNVIFTKESVESFLPYAKAIVTINSIQALQGLDYEIPIISFGDAFYNVDGIAVTPKSQKEIINVLESVSLYYDKNVACAFMNYIDQKTFEVSSLYNPSEQTFETIMRM